MNMQFGNNGPMGGNNTFQRRMDMERPRPMMVRDVHRPHLG